MQPDALQTLRQVNNSLRSALLRLRPEQTDCSTIRPQDFSDIRGQFLRAAECMRRQPTGSEAAGAFERETLEYRSNLEKLKDSLSGVQGRLLAEKSRLESAQSHVAAAVAWARASKATL